MRYNFYANSIAPEQLADLKFLASLIHGILGGFVGSQQQDRPEFSRLTDNVHLNLKQMFFFVELWIGIAEQSFPQVPTVLHAGTQRFERQYDNVARGVLCHSRNGLCRQAGYDK